MIPYMFVINGVPLPENHNYEMAGGAKIHIWVMDNDIESAEQKAVSYINQHLWMPQEIEYALEISSEQIPNLHKDEAQLYQKALQYGIAADFLAYQKIPGNPDDPVVIGRP